MYRTFFIYIIYIQKIANYNCNCNCNCNCIERSLSEQIDIITFNRHSIDVVTFNRHRRDAVRERRLIADTF